ncbi:MAG: hypothetical protein JSS99_02795 [Actinobacteria bacterium]|nr:hypothetical protein [Actinomycetota bacterium]
MTAIFLHQNMRRFGGAAPARKQAFRGDFVPKLAWPAVWGSSPPLGAYGFQAVKAAAAPERIVVAGFTELTTEASGVVAGGLADDLTGPGTTFVFHCGGSALGRCEWLAIKVAAGIKVQALGRVSVAPESDRDPAEAYTRPGDWMRALPDGIDYRCIPFVVVDLPGAAERSAVGFLHNVYNDEVARAAAMRRLADAASKIRANRACASQHVYVGGDFNVAPALRRGRYGIVLHPYSRGVAAPLRFPAAGWAGGTTASGNLYDYWMADVDPPDPAARPPRPGPQAFADSATLDGPRGLMSDHAASLLLVP